MKKYKCIANCLELDCDNEKHCTFTERELEDKKEYDEEVCPCGNRTKLVLINEEDELWL